MVIIPPLLGPGLLRFKLYVVKFGRIKKFLDINIQSATDLEQGMDPGILGGTIQDMHQRAHGNRGTVR